LISTQHTNVYYLFPLIEVEAEELLPSGPTQPTPVPPTQPAWNWALGGNEHLAVDFDESNSGWNTHFDVNSTEFDLLQKTFPEEVESDKDGG